MSNKSLLLASVLVAGAVGLSGCAAVPKFWARLKGAEPVARLDIRPAPAELQGMAQVDPADQLYQDAKRAMRKRDYAGALDLLQLAWRAAPEDPRVLNALGVVYDKLGRFDLSRRYYDLALAVEPNSAIVTANLDYSHRLEGHATALRSGTLLAAAPAGSLTRLDARDIAPPEPAEPATAPVQVAQAAVRSASGALLIGRGVSVVNASGVPGAQNGVQQYLASSGWTVRAQLQIRPVQPTSQIVFAEAHRPVAEALARTLPFEVALKPCVTACQGFELVVGSNARTSAVLRS